MNGNNRPRAVISLGTNSTRFLIVRDSDGARVEQLERGSIGTRLGEGLGERGQLVASAMERTLGAITQFMGRIRDHDAAVSCIATSAMRRASNAEHFIKRVRDVTSASLQILEGHEEAQDSFTGATYEAPLAANGRVVVIDVGGGSTECAVGRAGQLEDAISLEIGAVRLAELFPATMGATPADEARTGGRNARQYAATIAEDVSRYAPITEAVAVGGTPLTLGAIAWASNVDDVSGRILPRHDIDDCIERMLALDLNRRRSMPGMIAQRADILPAGAIILSETLRALHAESVTLRENDLLLGYLLRTR